MSEIIPPPLPQVNNRASKLTVSGLVLGIMGLFCGLFTGFPAAICGVISLFRLKKFPAQKNLTMVIITLCLAGGSVVTTGILAGLAIPGVQGVLDKAKQMSEVSNAKQIGLALFVYANDNDGKYPANRDEILSAFADDNFFSAPTVTETENGFILTFTYSRVEWLYFPGYTISDPPDTVLLQSADGHIIYTVGRTAEYLKQPRRR